MIRYLVLASTFVLLLVNVLAATGRINSTDTGAVSAAYPTEITPAGYAFTIWSLIYLGLLGFSFYQIFNGTGKEDPASQVRAPFLVTCLLNISWLYAWHYGQIPATAILMLALLAGLGYICVRLSETKGFLNNLLIKVPFGLYFGWITVAFILNVSILLVYYGIEFEPAAASATGAMLILVAGLIGTALRFVLKSFSYPLAIAWGLTAIAVKQSGDTVVVVASAVSVIVLLFVSLWGAVKDA